MALCLLAGWNSWREAAPVGVAREIDLVVSIGEGLAAMDMHPMSEPGMLNAHTDDPRTTALRNITAEQLLHLGTRQVVYLRSGTRDGEMAFMLYGADGVPLAMTDTIESAVDEAAERRLEFVALH